MNPLFILILLFSCLRVNGVSEVSVSVLEGDSVTLHTGVQTNQKDDIRWYFNNIRIARINGDLNKSCTDVQCNKGTESFRDRLKLDHQTGSLTITNTTNKLSGEYKLQIISSNIRENIFNVTVYDVPGAETKTKSVKSGKSVTLDPGVIKHPNDVMMWYYNDTRLAEITGDQSQICTDEQCKERFRDRLKLDHQTGSLTIMNTTNTDTGEYKLQINSSNDVPRRQPRISSIRRFSVTVTDSGLSSGAITGIVVGVVLLVSAAVIAALIYRRRNRHAPVPPNRNQELQMN
ncbi:carcinoembryonic antigen-related cell adhesion molecule 1-like [Pimephales promelas]|uniref:carcinoembryonic antigen-related cell adhesion molecule 1-like n=1 Tax=Pimephales promelas TaxID=90988 RepID=UPI001955A0AB|nr:carcinoembryonic antigen-related cell adhesion molecule 1-like [Pimephales promelas]